MNKQERQRQQKCQKCLYIKVLSVDVVKSKNVNTQQKHNKNLRKD